MISGSNSGFRALLTTQALSAFNHNLLRSALLTAAAFGSLGGSAFSPETTIALSTLLLVAPYAVMSLPAGRIADRFAKSTIIRITKLCEIAIFLIAGAGLMLMNVPILLLAMLLAGIEAAVFGPAKFGILPQLVKKQELINANAWVSASSTVAILAGLVSGNLLISFEFGNIAVAAFGLTLAMAGWAASLRIPSTKPEAPELPMNPAIFLSDYVVCFRRIGAFPVLLLPVFGCSWFWFQGAANTSLMPLYVAQTPGMPEGVVSVLLVASSIGIAVGAVGARWLVAASQARLLPWAAFLIIFLPGLDLLIGGPVESGTDIVRAALDFFVLAGGCGLYAVPLAAAVQQLTPDNERARFVAANHTLNGLAMIASSAVVLLLNLPGVSAEWIFFATALVSGIVAAFALLSTMPILTSGHNAHIRAA